MKSKILVGCNIEALEGQVTEFIKNKKIHFVSYATTKYLDGATREVFILYTDIENEKCDD